MAKLTLCYQLLDLHFLLVSITQNGQTDTLSSASWLHFLLVSITQHGQTDTVLSAPWLHFLLVSITQNGQTDTLLSVSWLYFLLVSITQDGQTDTLIPERVTFSHSLTADWKLSRNIIARYEKKTKQQLAFGLQRSPCYDCQIVYDNVIMLACLCLLGYHTPTCRGKPYL